MPGTCWKPFIIIILSKTECAYEWFISHYRCMLVVLRGGFPHFQEHHLLIHFIIYLSQHIYINEFSYIYIVLYCLERTLRGFMCKQAYHFLFFLPFFCWFLLEKKQHLSASSKNSNLAFVLFSRLPTSCTLPPLLLQVSLYPERPGGLQDTNRIIAIFQAGS